MKPLDNLERILLLNLWHLSSSMLFENPFTIKRTQNTGKISKGKKKAGRRKSLLLASWYLVRFLCTCIAQKVKIRSLRQILVNSKEISIKNYNYL